MPQAKKTRYYQDIDIPVKTISISRVLENEKLKRGKWFFRFRKAGYLGLLLLLVFSQAGLFSAFEAHIINVTARICDYSEIRSRGYWRTHPQVYTFYLPQILGNEDVITAEDVEAVFAMADGQDMKNQLKAQLLAMKFNVVHFGVGGYEYEDGKTINDLVALADALLIDPNSTRQELEDVKEILAYLNTLHQLRHCPDANALVNSIDVIGDYNMADECMKINEVFYEVDDDHGNSSSEWIELYNACSYPVSLYGWSLMSSTGEELIEDFYLLESGQFAVITANDNTWQYWLGIPEAAIKIALGGDKLFNKLGDASDWLQLYDGLGNLVDTVAWGTGIVIFTPPVPDVSAGSSIARIEKGVDTDTAADWHALLYPNPGTNPHPFVQFVIELFIPDTTITIEPVATTTPPVIDSPATTTQATTTPATSTPATTTEPTPTLATTTQPTAFIPEPPATTTEPVATTTPESFTTTTEPVATTTPSTDSVSTSTDPTPATSTPATTTDPIL